MRMPFETRKLMLSYANTLKPSSAKAQCLSIAGLSLEQDETIANRIKRDHCDSTSYLRVATLMSEAGAAIEKPGKKYCYGTFTFEDGSIF